MPSFPIFWGDTHHNTYMGYRQDPPLDDVLADAAVRLDFYTGAYYTPVFRPASLRPEYLPAPAASTDGHPGEQSPAPVVWKGVSLEGLKDPAAMAREWAEFQEVTRAWNRPSRFVAFPGYEWQGNGRWGDHNVIFKQEGHGLSTPDGLPALYAALRGIEALVIPHHTAYSVPQRAPDWSRCDETYSPFAELYSIHGCSETDEEWIGLRGNSHMGPGVGGGTYQEALDMGLHLGAIASTDNWSNVPGCWNQGLAACLAEDLTRERIWAAFRERRVYGVSGDRIELDFTCNEQPMGRILGPTPERRIRARVRGQDAIDRIELLRNGQVIATHHHQGTWDTPPSGRRCLFKLRIEPGWGPRVGELPSSPRVWNGEIEVGDGVFHAWSPCWIARGQQAPVLQGCRARFQMLSRQENVTRPMQGATVFELEADPDAPLKLRLNDLTLTGTIRELATRSHLLWYRDECMERIQRMTGVTPDTAGRGDIYYHHAYKAKIHRIIPESGFSATMTHTDREPLERETHYRVRVEQRNGQRAWSSPIWVAAGH